jgi:hypothetical protein
MHVVPGISRSLVYTVPRDDTSSAPALIQLKRYITQRNNRLGPDDYLDDLDPEFVESPDSEAVMKAPRMDIPLDKFGEIILPPQLRWTLFRNGVKCIAWDEGVGRACIVPGGECSVYLLDFARTPIICTSFAFFIRCLSLSLTGPHSTQSTAS